MKTTKMIWLPMAFGLISFVGAYLIGTETTAGTIQWVAGLWFWYRAIAALELL